MGYREIDRTTKKAVMPRRDGTGHVERNDRRFPVPDQVSSRRVGARLARKYLRDTPEHERKTSDEIRIGDE